MIAFGAVVIAGSLQVGIGWGAEGPKSGFFPFYLGVSIIAASALNLVAAHAQGRQKVFADWSQLGSVLQVVIPTTVYVFAVPWAGIYLSSLISSPASCDGSAATASRCARRCRSASRSRPI
jgi:hypothetical protein